MKKSYMFLATGFEETEAIAPIDVMRRAGMEVVLVSITDSLAVEGAHGVFVNADAMFGEVDFNDAEWLICPGGLPGATNLAEFEPLCELLKYHFASGGRVAAICASPGVVLAPLGILDERNAACYPGAFADACPHYDPTHLVVTDQNVVTGAGPAAAYAFGFAIVENTLGVEAAKAVSEGMLFC
ncbi:MAG: DJ-1/PfpI family protein [Bacteroidaceae bacterium]|nr:DJ-1/PfpI family protein [Bacteroidaceae bacterium]